MNPYDESKRTELIKDLDYKTEYGGKRDSYKKDYIDVNTINLDQTHT